MVKVPAAHLKAAPESCARGTVSQLHALAATPHRRIRAAPLHWADQQVTSGRPNAKSGVLTKILEQAQPVCMLYRSGKFEINQSYLNQTTRPLLLVYRPLRQTVTRGGPWRLPRGSVRVRRGQRGTGKCVQGVKRHASTRIGKMARFWWSDNQFSKHFDCRKTVCVRSS